MADCGCGGFKSVNGLGASPDGLGQYDINRAGDFGALNGFGAVATTTLACAVSGAIMGSLAGALVGYLALDDVKKGAMYGAGIGAAGRGLMCGYAMYRLDSFASKYGSTAGTSGVGAYYAV